MYDLLNSGEMEVGEDNSQIHIANLQLAVTIHHLQKTKSDLEKALRKNSTELEATKAVNKNLKTELLAAWNVRDMLREENYQLTEELSSYFADHPLRIELELENKSLRSKLNEARRRIIEIIEENSKVCGTPLESHWKPAGVSTMKRRVPFEDSEFRTDPLKDVTGFGNISAGSSPSVAKRPQQNETLNVKPSSDHPDIITID